MQLKARKHSETSWQQLLISFSLTSRFLFLAAGMCVCFRVYTVTSLCTPWCHGIHHWCGFRCNKALSWPYPAITCQWCWRWSEVKPAGNTAFSFKVKGALWRFSLLGDVIHSPTNDFRLFHISQFTVITSKEMLQYTNKARKEDD